MPTQFDEFTMGDRGNQCAFCAHQFALRAGALLDAMAAGTDVVQGYRACMAAGTAKRQRSCDAGTALPVGENIDDPVVLRSAQETLRDDPSATDPRLSPPRIVRASPGSVFHQQRPFIAQMIPDPQLAARVLAASDEERHPEATRADFEAALRALPAGGAMVLERHIEAMTLIRTRSAGEGEAFLVCDSHATRCGLATFDGAVQYVFGLIPRADFPLTFMCTAE